MALLSKICILYAQQIPFNVKMFGNKCRGCKESPLYGITLVLGIGQENHNRLSDELNRLIIDCTIGFLLAMSNNIHQVP